MMAWVGMGLFTSSELLKLFESEDLKPTPITGVAVSQWAVTTVTPLGRDRGQGIRAWGSSSTRQDRASTDLAAAHSERRCWKRNQLWNEHPDSAMGLQGWERGSAASQPGSRDQT